MSHVIVNAREAFYSVLNIHLSGVLTALLVVTWLVPRTTSAISAHSVYTIQPCTIPHHFMQSQIRTQGACLFSCNLPFVLLAEWLGSFTCYCSTQTRVSRESWHWRRKFSHLSHWDSNLRPFDHESGTLTTELSTFPIITHTCRNVTAV